ncbi:MAG: hypothetical protein JWM74_5323 [Myxococcaceae bacterium]|nr:hypothetical protein [Myxococcaceae bacterium]
MKKDDTRRFYDDLAEHYHLLFEDWARSVAQQGDVLDRVVRRRFSGDERPSVLDAACGIGTQALGLLERGYRIVGADLSASAVARASREASARGLVLDACVADLRTIDADVPGVFDVVLACDNALPHLLTDEDLRRALSAMRAKLRPGGQLLASIRDYDALLRDRPRFMSERVLGDGETRRVLFQVWDWTADARYRVHQFIVRPGTTGWSTLHFEADYRALRRDELADAVRATGFVDVRWLEPAESGYYQPLLLADAPHDARS